MLDATSQAAAPAIAPAPVVTIGPSTALAALQLLEELMSQCREGRRLAYSDLLPIYAVLQQARNFTGVAAVACAATGRPVHGGYPDAHAAQDRLA